MRACAQRHGDYDRRGALALPPTPARTPDQAPRLQCLRVPARPHLKYPREWEGYDAWLGLPETPLTFPAGFGGAGADVSRDHAGARKLGSEQMSTSCCY